ncbi:GNAT family N-acetyltransferase [Sphingomonas solaris]|uniref:GNAT family N-acetyltransferase n=1 Tax=Alterirhizorhabdus solaris TaxID=2529389 RepID=UPI001EF0988D|nr:GNAT family N-acetyltransferase [Sphingomonas solaris]
MSLAIRPATTDDAPAIAAIYAHYVEHGVATFEEVAPDAAEMAARIAAVVPAYPWLVAERHGRIVGYAYGRPYHPRAAYRWTVETAIYLATDARRTGAGRPLYEALLDDLADRGFVSAIAVITVPNPESTRFHEKQDFTQVGVMEGIGFKHGAWRNVGYFQLALGPRSVPPPKLAV